ncbi:Uncharacterised protein [Mycobacteroides abscessus subsp. abscessus]|nr:Uncharacterised protein [Mycobacteroides abscessus subsp. abscessus]
MQPREQIGPRRVQWVVTVEIGSQWLDGVQSGLWCTVAFRDGHRTVEGDHGRGSESHQLVVQGDDLAPIGACCRRGVVMNRVDGGLDLIRPRGVAPQAAAHQLVPLGDHLQVPSGAVLIGE